VAARLIALPNGERLIMRAHRAMAMPLRQARCRCQSNAPSFGYVPGGFD